MLPVAEKVPLTGSNNSAEFSLLDALRPPVTNTLPVNNKAFLCCQRAVVMGPVVKENAPVV
jgi:hypothetical protein